jgi:hypothetical protein
MRRELSFPIITKEGAGSPVKDGDRLVLNLRLAASLEDLMDDARVVLTTYRRDRSLRVVYSRATLRADVYGALCGIRQGGTRVLEIDIEEELATAACPPGKAYLEVWAEEVSEIGENDVEVLASSLAIENSTFWRPLLDGAVNQPNGVMVSVSRVHESVFLALIRRVCALSALAPARKVRDPGPAEQRVGYVLSKELFEAVRSEMRG